MSLPLPTYLKAYRRRLGLTQAELGLLLGHETAANVSRYERAERLPSLEAALALELVLDVRTNDLFPLYAASLREELLARVEALGADLDAASTALERHKHRSVADMHARLAGDRPPLL